MNHGKHYKLFWFKKPHLYVHKGQIFHNTLVHPDEVHIVPSFGFPPNVIGTEFVQDKKKGLVLILDIHTHQILFAGKWNPPRSKPKSRKRSKSRKSKSRSISRRGKSRKTRKSKTGTKRRKSKKSKKSRKSRS